MVIQSLLLISREERSNSAQRAPLTVTPLGARTCRRASLPLLISWLSPGPRLFPTAHQYPPQHAHPAAGECTRCTWEDGVYPGSRVLYIHRGTPPTIPGHLSPTIPGHLSPTIPSIYHRVYVRRYLSGPTGVCTGMPLRTHGCVPGMLHLPTGVYRACYTYPQVYVRGYLSYLRCMYGDTSHTSGCIWAYPTILQGVYGHTLPYPRVYLRGVASLPRVYLRGVASLPRARREAYTPLYTIGRAPRGALSATDTRFTVGQLLQV